MSKASIILFISWIVCGGCVESMLDDKRVFVVAVVALIVAVVCGLRVVRGGPVERW